MKTLSLIILVTALLPNLVQAHEQKEEIVELLCMNAAHQELIYSLTKSDYEFLRFGNNRLEGPEISIQNKKRTEGFNLYHKKAKNLSEAFYDCYLKK